MRRERPDEALGWNPAEPQLQGGSPRVASALQGRASALAGPVPTTEGILQTAYRPRDLPGPRRCARSPACGGFVARRTPPWHRGIVPARRPTGGLERGTHLAAEVLGRARRQRARGIEEFARERETAVTRRDARRPRTRRTRAPRDVAGRRRGDRLRPRGRRASAGARSRRRRTARRGSGARARIRRPRGCEARSSATAPISACVTRPSRPNARRTAAAPPPPRPATSVPERTTAARPGWSQPGAGAVRQNRRRPRRRRARRSRDAASSTRRSSSASRKSLARRVVGRAVPRDGREHRDLRSADVPAAGRRRDQARGLPQPSARLVRLVPRHRLAGGSAAW